MVFSRSYRYRFGDIDHAGIAYYPALMHYFHCAMEDWFADGLGQTYPSVINDERFGLPAVNIQADFFGPIAYGDEPVVSVAVLGLGRTSVTLGMWMTLPGQDRPACRARIVTVSVDMDTMAKQPIPAKWRAAFEKHRITEEEFPG